MQYNMTRQSKQQICPILIITEAKKSHFFAWNKLGLSIRTSKICKNDSDSSSNALIVTPSRVYLWKTWLESSHNRSYRDSNQLRVTKNCDLSRVTHWLESRFHCQRCDWVIFVDSESSQSHKHSSQSSHRLVK